MLKKDEQVHNIVVKKTIIFTDSVVRFLKLLSEKTLSPSQRQWMTAACIGATLWPVCLRQPNQPSFSLAPLTSYDTVASSGARHWASSSRQTMDSLLRRYGVSDPVIASLVRSMPNSVRKKWKSGLKIALDMHQGVLQGITLYTGVFQAWKASPSSQDGSWRFVAYHPPIERSYQRVAIAVGTQNLSRALLQQAPTKSLGQELVRACQQSGIHWGSLRHSTVHMMYQKVRNLETQEDGLGHVAMVRVEHKGRPVRTYYAYAPERQKRFAFYSLAGVCAQHSLVSMTEVWGQPVRHARCSSLYGMRIHPTLHCRKFHKGVDFAGCKNTPILATSAGVVRCAGTFSTYGKRVEIQHGPVYRSLYAHLNQVAKGIRPGVRVQKGQIIGYMGDTGRTSGVHLHFEIQRSGRPINPMHLLGQKTQHGQGPRFNASQLKRFKAYVAMLNKRYVALGRQALSSS